MRLLMLHPILHVNVNFGVTRWYTSLGFLHYAVPHLMAHCKGGSVVAWLRDGPNGDRRVAGLIPRPPV